MKVQHVVAAMLMFTTLVLSAGFAPAASLNGTSWLLKTLNGHPLKSSRQPTLNVENGKAFGYAGCNTYFGKYTEGGGNSFHIENIVITKMACMPVTQESQFVSALKDATSYHLVGKTMTLKNKKGVSLAVFNSQSQGIKGTSWKVGEIEGSSIIAGSKITATFGTNGTVNGSAGCNSYSGSYTSSISGKQISINKLILTKKMCHKPVGVMMQESQFVEMLKAAKTYRIEANRLTISKADGSRAVVLYKK
ncbi:META domain-containing protein [Desulfobulbus sp. F5]|nr:META domain-containing protein [Desulfobulbus sp. F5]